MNMHDVLLCCGDQTADFSAKCPAEVRLYGYRLPRSTDSNFALQDSLEHVCSKQNLHLTWLSEREVKSL